MMEVLAKNCLIKISWNFILDVLRKDIMYF